MAYLAPDATAFPCLAAVLCPDATRYGIFTFASLHYNEYSRDAISDSCMHAHKWYAIWLHLPSK